MSVLGIVGGLVLIALLILLNGRAAPSVSPVLRATAPLGIASEGYVLGAATAPVTIDLYEDFQCPACQRWGANVLPSLVRNELAAGTVKIAFHSFAFLGPESVAAGRAAWAAGQQGRFWDLWATLYANQGARENDGSFSRDRLLVMAAALDLDPVRFATDLVSVAAATWVSDGVTEAARAGVQATPTLLIDGVPLAGSGYGDVAAAIAAAAAE